MHSEACRRHCTCARGVPDALSATHGLLLKRLLQALRSFLQLLLQGLQVRLCLSWHRCGLGSLLHRRNQWLKVHTNAAYRLRLKTQHLEALGAAMGVFQDGVKET